MGDACYKDRVGDITLINLSIILLLTDFTFYSKIMLDLMFMAS